MSTFNYFKTSLATSSLLVSFCTGHTQNDTLKQQHIYFTPNQFSISPQSQQELKTLFSNGPIGSKVYIEGHTDNAGNYITNMSLSEKRVLAVKTFLLQAGIADSVLATGYRGAANPIASNSTPEGRSLNRRVTVTVLQQKKTVNKRETSIDDLFGELATPLQTFSLNSFRDTVLVCSGGTALFIERGTLLPLNADDKNNITLNVREDLSIGDMLSDNLTTTSGKALIETSGMLYTEAFDSKKNAIDIQKGKRIVVTVPADTINGAVQLFDGERTGGKGINWTTDNSDAPSGFYIPACLSCIREYEKKPFMPVYWTFFDRIIRAPRLVTSLFSEKVRSDNRFFREHNRMDKLHNRNNIPDTGYQQADMRGSKDTACHELLALYWKYRAFDDTALLKEINRPILNRYRAYTYEEFLDIAAQIRPDALAQLEATGLRYFDNRRYYTFFMKKLKWKNLDMFLKYPPEQLTKVAVNIAPGLNTDCKMVFKKRKVIVSAHPEKEGYVFDGVPKGEKATLVVLKYQNGQRFIGLKSIEAHNIPFDVPVRAVSMDELKQELKRVN